MCKKLTLPQIRNLPRRVMQRLSALGAAVSANRQTTHAARGHGFCQLPLNDARSSTAAASAMAFAISANPASVQKGLTRASEVSKSSVRVTSAFVCISLLRRAALERGAGLSVYWVKASSLWLRHDELMRRLDFPATLPREPRLTFEWLSLVGKRRQCANSCPPADPSLLSFLDT